MLEINIILEGQLLASNTLQHLLRDTQSLPTGGIGQSASKPSTNQPSPKPTNPSLRSFNGYFRTRLDLQLAKAESLAG